MNRETLYSIIIIIVLCVIAAGMLIVQGRFEPQDFFAVEFQKDKPGSQVKQISPPDDVLSAFAIDGYKPMGEKEEFNEENLSDKINGKADLYLECGFVSMASRRFADIGEPSRWFEIYFYNMGEPQNAYAVYSQQRRRERKDSSVAPLAYTVENAVFFMNGKYYFEIVSAEASDEMVLAVEQAAAALMKSMPPEPFAPRELSFLPEENRIKGSEKLFLKNAFGFDKFPPVLLAQYNLNGDEITVFIAALEEDAKPLMVEYVKFMKEVGATETADAIPPIPDAVVMEMSGETEIVFAHGNILGGIHAAAKRESALALIPSIYEKAKNTK